MKTQIVYETNTAYEATYQKLAESELVIADKTKKGLIWFRFKGTKTIFILSPYGKLQVKWSNPEEKKILLRIIRNLLVPKNGQNLELNPMGQQTFIPYPEPSSFKLFWCDEETEYIRTPARTIKRESVILTFFAVIIMSIFGFIALQKLGKTALYQIANQTGLEAERIMIQVTPYLILVPGVVFAFALLLTTKPAIQRKLKLLKL